MSKEVPYFPGNTWAKPIARHSTTYGVKENVLNYGCVGKVSN